MLWEETVTVSTYSAALPTLAIHYAFCVLKEWTMKTELTLAHLSKIYLNNYNVFNIFLAISKAFGIMNSCDSKHNKENQESLWYPLLLTTFKKESIKTNTGNYSLTCWSHFQSSPQIPFLILCACFGVVRRILRHLLATCKRMQFRICKVYFHGL